VPSEVAGYRTPWCGSGWTWSRTSVVNTEESAEQLWSIRRRPTAHRATGSQMRAHKQQACLSGVTAAPSCTLKSRPPLKPEKFFALICREMGRSCASKPRLRTARAIQLYRDIAISETVPRTRGAAGAHRTVRNALHARSAARQALRVSSRHARVPGRTFPPPVRRPDVPLRSAGGRLMRIRLTAAGREWAAVTRRERAGDQRVAGYCARAAKTALS
jgi:hypothetical protein